jgi:microcin C transport system substrate-binding protein
MIMIRRTLASLVIGVAVVFAAGCGEDGADDERFPPIDNTAEVEAHYRDKVWLPPDVFEAFQRGEIAQEEIDRRTAAGEFQKFFQYATLADLPADLVWEDGSGLEEFASPQAKKGGTLYSWVQDFPRTLRRFGPDANGSFRPYILDFIAMQLAKRHPNDTSIGPTGFHYYPGIADRWALADDKATVYVHIDESARFSDGEPITVDNMFFMFFIFQSEYGRAPWYYNWYNRTYRNIRQYDEHTFSITLAEAKPDAKFKVLELEPLPRNFFREFGEDYAERYQWRFVPTSGAYIVKSEDVQKGRSIALTRNPDWWAKDKPFWRYRYNFDRIYFPVIRDIPKAFESFKKGEADRFGLSLAEYWYDKLPDDDPLVQAGYIHKAVFFNDTPRPTYGLWINTSKPLLGNRDIRVGIHHATNWQLVIDKFFRGDYVRMRTTADGYGEFTHPTLQPREFSVQKALEHFARAGFTQRGADGVLTNAAGQRLSFTLTTGYQSLKDILTILRQEALKVGLEFRLEVLDNTAAFKKVQEKKHDIQFTAFSVAAEMYPRYWETYHSVNAYDRPYLEDGSPNPDRKVKTQTNNLESVAVRDVDLLIEQYRSSADAQQMKGLALRLEELLHDHASFVPGFVAPFFRVGYWRWIVWPEDFSVKLSRSGDEMFLSWIDTDLKQETLEARKAGRSFEPVIRIHDQYRAP